MRAYNNILEAIGNTPLVKLNKVVPKNSADVYVKCEFMNPTGSIKDRMALYIIEQAEKNGLLKPGGTIVENTSGNTGLALAMVAAVKGYKAIFTLPDKMSKEKIDMIKSFGAEVVITPTDVPGDSPEHYVETAKRIARQTPNSFYVDQYHCQDNINAHYHSTGREIWEETGGEFDYFVAGTGTGGTASGVGRYLKEKTDKIKIVGVDPIGSIHYHYFYTKNLVTPHVYKVEGIGEDILCRALDFSVIDKMYQTNDQEAFSMARRLVREEGLFCGGSSGAIVYGACKLAKEVGPNKKIITVLTDSGSRYISKFLSDSWMQDHGFYDEKPDSIKIGNILDTVKTDLITANKSDNIEQIINKMQKTGVSQLPIIDENNIPIGIVHEFDILKNLQNNSITNKTKVENIANPISGMLNINAPLQELYPVFNNFEIAVITKENQIAGVISKIDLINYLTKKTK